LVSSTEKSASFGPLSSNTTTKEKAPSMMRSVSAKMLLSPAQQPLDPLLSGHVTTRQASGVGQAAASQHVQQDQAVAASLPTAAVRVPTSARSTELPGHADTRSSRDQQSSAALLSSYYQFTVQSPPAGNLRNPVGARQMLARRNPGKPHTPSPALREFKIDQCLPEMRPQQVWGSSGTLAKVDTCTWLGAMFSDQRHMASDPGAPRAADAVVPPAHPLARITAAGGAGAVPTRSSRPQTPLLSPARSKAAHLRRCLSQPLNSGSAPGRQLTQHQPASEGQTLGKTMSAAAGAIQAVAKMHGDISGWADSSSAAAQVGQPQSGRRSTASRGLGVGISASPGHPPLLSSRSRRRRGASVSIVCKHIEPW
jgi:hypothetical protein